jgi:hypothetical protein
MCRLLGDEAEVLAEDKVYLIPRAGDDWGVADAWPQTARGALSEEEAMALESVPLKALFRLYQAPRTRLERVDALVAVRHLTEAFFELAWHQYLDVGAKKASYASLARVGRCVPTYELCFVKSPRVVELVLQMN